MDGAWHLRYVDKVVPVPVAKQVHVPMVSTVAHLHLIEVYLSELSEDYLFEILYVCLRFCPDLATLEETPSTICAETIQNMLQHSWKL